jgi:hypothetical protein
MVCGGLCWMLAGYWLSVGVSPLVIACDRLLLLGIGFGFEETQS